MVRFVNKWNNIKEFSADVSCVKFDNEFLEPITVTKALNNVGSLAPILLKKTLDYWKKKWQGMGVPIENKCLFSLNYADDQVIIAQDADDLEFTLKKDWTRHKK